MSTFSKPMMMTERQKKFRESYVNQISPFYNGLLHIGVMYVAGITAIYYCTSQLSNPTWAWLTIIPVAIAGNLVS